METLSDLLERTIRAHPRNPALVTSQTKIRYEELGRRVLSAASGFSCAGVRKGDCVAIILRNSPEFVITYFALSRLGAVAVPINFMVQKAEELAYMLNDCKAIGLVTQREFLKGVRQAAAHCAQLKHLWVTDFDAAQSSLEKPFLDLQSAPPLQLSGCPAVSEDEIAAILYTSGTTGHPKGVVLTHKNLVSNCDASIAHLDLKSKDVILGILPFFHTLAWTANVLVPLRLGLKLAISSHITPPKPWLSLMAREGVTLFTAVPQLYSVLAKQATGLKGLVLRWWFFRKVRLAISGSAPLSPAVQESFEKALGIPILEGYGLTETSPVIAVSTLAARKIASVGRPLSSVLVRIADEGGNPLPAGQEGEICVRGDNVMKGYYNLPEATAEAFTKDGWLKTGDIGIVDEDGFLFIRDRKKDMIIIKGLKVFPAQLEALIAEHPDVQEAAVIGIPDEHGDETIKAFVVPRPQSSIDKAALMRYCRAKFDPYKRPRDIEIVASLPKNALQKVLKRELRQQELRKKAVA